MDVDLDDMFDTEPAQDGPTGEHAEPLFADDDDDDDANENADGENQDDAQKKTDEANAADPKPKKKRVSRPQPKLNGDRLCGARGIGIMEEAFSDLVFSGRGYERRDLNLLMGRMQHWAHRMFPKMPFDQAIERIEKLGRTKQVQVNVRKIRMGMNVLPTEVPAEDATERGDPERDVFDELIGEAPPSPTPPAERPASPPQPAASTLTEEQRERMRKNREAAQLRRMRAQFARQQQESPAESGQETQGGSGSARVPAAGLKSAASQPQSPAGRRSPASAEAGGGHSPSQSGPGGGGDVAAASDSDVEMGEDRVPSPVGTEDSLAAAGQETSAPRLGQLHQMSETAPVWVGEETEPDAATEGTEAVVVVAEDQETSVSRTGHLHQMSETVPIEVDDDRETEAIVIPDDEGTEAVAVAKDRETEAIVIPDEPETDAIMIPDDDETELMLASEAQDTESVIPHESTEATHPTEAHQETSTARVGHLHQMSETEPPVSAGDREGDGRGREGPVSEADTGRVRSDDTDPVKD